MAVPTIHSLSPWDYMVIVSYFAFVLSIGWLFRRANKNASDYFRGGGNMLWWVAGMSVMASSISTWTFTGGAAKCYNDGFVLPVTYWLGAFPTLLAGLWAAPIMRRYRVITAIEAVYRRFGGGTEQFFTWTMLPLGLFIGGVGLNTLGVFMASTFQAPLPVMIAALGLIVTVMSTLGGQWGVSAGAFVQGLMMFLIVAVVVVLSINLPQIGGPAHVLQALPAHDIRFDMSSRSALVGIWIGWQVFMSFFNPLDIRGCGKMVRAKDEGHARKMILLMAFPSVVLFMPLWMQLPAMCAAVVFPDMHALFPKLAHPEEAAWVAMSFKVLPQGLLGVFICGMFAAGIDAFDSGLNSNSGFFVRNVYYRFINPQATDKQQLLCGKVATATFGVMMVGIGLVINALRTTNLFDFFLMFNAMVNTPMMMPMIMGLIVRRSPPWTGWSTVVVGLAAASVAAHFYSPAIIQHAFHYATPLSQREITDSQFIFVSVVTTFVCAAWFLGTARLYQTSPAPFKEKLDELENDLATPVDRSSEPDGEADFMQYHVIGKLCASMGGFFAVCMAIPNPMSGRLIFGVLASLIGGLGLALLSIYRRLTKVTAARPSVLMLDDASSETSLETTGSETTKDTVRL